MNPLINMLHGFGIDLLMMYCVYLGALYPASMRINDIGRLVVNFRTKAHFRGLFVASHHGESYLCYFSQLSTFRKE